MGNTPPRLIHDPTSRLVARLERMLANLQAHIDQRAQELAQPLIDEAREAAAAEVSGARGMQRRAEDLNVELRRQIRPLERQVNEYRQRAKAAEAVIANIRQIHARDDSNPHGPWCSTCTTVWPCATWRALDGEEPDLDH